jgi:hypothetical protein
MAIRRCTSCVQALLTLGHVLRELGARSRDLFDKLSIPAIRRERIADAAKRHNLERELSAPVALAETHKLNDAPIGRCAPACRWSTPRFGISRLKIETASPAPTSAPA